MSAESRFTFIALPKKVSHTLNNKDNQENLLKWGLKSNLNVQFYNFNQEFKIYDKQDFVDSFFHDPAVRNSLNLFTPVERVEFVTVPCAQVSMRFFDKMKNEENGIVRCGYLTECLDEFVDGMLLQDNLRQMMVMEDHAGFNLYDAGEKQEFIFQLFKHVCLGGAYAQHDLKIGPYLEMTKSLYKELVDVEKILRTNELRVRSVVMRVVCYAQDHPVMPAEPDHPQNFMYLIVDPFKRQVAVLYHKFGGYVAP
ncbi:hypothetical protein GE061_003139 [Apolygus lucorum]|uniref:Cilia- and flagella-associated protein 300 n=1 Tax=Apolygus lucorum TaxID=248454 RepID=A0A6A4J4J5_APOLU|nr:hypothetical protein GE061_003139 [Apolygus lucorum]